MVGSDFVVHSRLRVAAAGRSDPRQRKIEVERFDAVDLMDEQRVERYVHECPEPVVVNFAARTDVDGIEQERAANRREGGPAWVVNAAIPGAVARAAARSGKSLVHISTDFVFDGSAGPYLESAARSPLSPTVSWYGWTKSEGERKVLEGHPAPTIVRLGYPYRSDFPWKIYFARWIMNAFREGRLPPLYSDQTITPTWIPDVTRVASALVARPRPGVFHVASPAVTTPHEFGTELLNRLENRTILLDSSQLASMTPPLGRAPRPVRGGLRVTRLTELGVRPTTWREGIHQLIREERGRP